VADIEPIAGGIAAAIAETLWILEPLKGMKSGH
jgi:hypothetical protein